MVTIFCKDKIKGVVSKLSKATIVSPTSISLDYKHNNNSFQAFKISDMT